MGHGFIMGAGGGGSDMFAAIAVEYEQGLSCTCTNGISSLDPADTSGQYIFAIPSTGNWTVTSGNFTKTVAITGRGQCEKVRLTRRMLLHGTSYDETWNRSATTGHNYSSGSGLVPTVTLTSDGAHLEMPAGSGYRFGCFHTDQKINLTNYDFLRFDLKLVNIVMSGSDIGRSLHVWITSNVSDAKFGASVVKDWVIDTQENGNYTNQLISLAGITGEYYIAVDVHVRASATSFYLDNVYLE